jgi:pyruvate,water dikinase
MPAFKLEIAAVKKVRNEMGLKNLWCMIPFNRTVEEFVKVRDLMQGEGLKQDEDFKLWIMAEVPSNILLADEFCKAGVDGFSIGSNDLTMLILGADRDSEILAPLFDERNLAVKRAIKSLIETAHRYGKTVSICGQAPSVYSEFTKFLVELDIDSISVNPDVVIQTRNLVAQVEQRLLLEGLKTRRRDQAT